ncbi:PH domain-containing protein [Nocardioides sp.]|uniref:PH domain-containing protein n=1 Tax=Nocardioides sp. TaxID=35761 RepID=UPI0039E4DDF6
MPAGSEPSPEEPEPPPLPLPRTWRPLGPRIVAAVLVVGLVVVCTMSWLSFDAETQAKFTLFEKLTLAFIALLILVCVHAITRSRVTATRDRLTVVNGYRRRDLAWAQIVAVRLPRGAPWVRLDLSDGSEISAMGIQASDGASARTAVRTLRQLATELTR